MNASNTSSSLLPTKLSQLPNLHTFITSSLFNVLVVLSLNPLLLLLGNLHHPLLKFLIAAFSMLYRVSGINFLYLFVNLILVPVPSPTTSPISSYSSVSPLCLFITTSLFHSRLNTYLLHKSFPCSFTSSSQTAFTDFCLRCFF